MKLPEGGLFVDGGLTWNYPLSVYDDSNYLSNADDEFLYSVIDQLQDINSKQFYNKETLGLMVETRSMRKVNPSELYDENKKIKSFPNYLKAMLGLMTDVTAGNYLSLPDWQRTIFIEAYGVRSTDFNISSYGIERLIDSGRRAAVAYLDWFKKPGMEQMNKVVHNN
jgi:NTE family protein